MDRIINIKINGNYLTKDNKKAGVTGEANVTKLRITFDEGWDNFAKTVTFWDALGENPVKRILTTDLLENAAANTRIYLCPIPGEPLVYPGDMTFAVDGYVDGKRQRSCTDELFVEYAEQADNAGEPADPTPTQAEQLQAQIEAVKDDVKKAAEGAEHAEQAAGYAAAAAGSAQDAGRYATDADGSAARANAAADEAEGYARQAGEAVADAAEDAARQAAADVLSEMDGYASSARASAEQAGAHSSNAEQYAANASGSKGAAAESARNAAASESAAAGSAQNAAQSANAAAARSSEAQAAASEAKTAVSNANQAVSGANKALNEANDLRDDAEGHAEAARQHSLASFTYMGEASGFANSAKSSAAQAERLAESLHDAALNIDDDGTVYMDGELPKVETGTSLERCNIWFTNIALNRSWTDPILIDHIKDKYGVTATKDALTGGNNYLFSTYDGYMMGIGSVTEITDADGKTTVFVTLAGKFDGNGIIGSNWNGLGELIPDLIELGADFNDERFWNVPGMKIFAPKTRSSSAIYVNAPWSDARLTDFTLIAFKHRAGLMSNNATQFVLSGANTNVIWMRTMVSGAWGKWDHFGNGSNIVVWNVKGSKQYELRWDDSANKIVATEV